MDDSWGIITWLRIYSVADLGLEPRTSGLPHRQVFPLYYVLVNMDGKVLHRHNFIMSSEMAQQKTNLWYRQDGVVDPGL